MKKLLTLGFLLFVVICGAFAQASVAPDHKFYKSVERWENMGLIKEQLPLRPYPLSIVENILNEVIESEDEEEVEIAEALYAETFGKPYSIRAEGIGQLKLDSEDKDKQITGLFSLDGDYAFSDLVTVGYQVGLSGVMYRSDTILPRYSQSKYYLRDAAHVGPVDAYLEMDGSFAVGTDKIYVQGGVNHNSFGSFYDASSVLSSDAKHTAGFSFVYNPGKWSYTQALLGLSASNNSDELFSQKYLAVHSINTTLLEWFSLGFYEVSIFGGRFEPAYIIPLPYMITQGLTGFDDNVLMGLTFTVKPVKNLSWKNDFYIDDLSVNDIVKLNLDSKIRGAFQTGFFYVPENVRKIRGVNLSYVMVTPYMYTHKQNIIDNKDGSYVTGSLKTINYQEYTTAGSPLVPSLEPNMDRVALSFELEPVKNLSITVKGSFARHANVNENLPVDEAIDYLNAETGYFSTDGGIKNHSHYFSKNEEGKYESYYLPSAWNHFLFMCQDTKMYTTQAGFDMTYSLPKMKLGSLSVSVGYLFEYIHNYGVDNPIYTGTAPAGTYYQEGNTEADVQAALNAWKANLKDVANHYVTVGFKYIW